MSLADQYYLKALDAYSCNYDEALENLNYALSTDERHAGANFLMGLMRYQRFDDFEGMEYYFQMALSENPYDWRIYDWYSHILIYRGAWKRAEKMVDFAKKIEGVPTCEIEYKWGQIEEAKGNLKNAKKHFKLAIISSQNWSQRNFFNSERNRIQEKLKELKMKKKKKKGGKKNKKKKASKKGKKKK